VLNDQGSAQPALRGVRNPLSRSSGGGNREKNDVEQDQDDSNYSKLVGLRLRAVRRQKRLSLHDVETDSSKEFKASVLGAYERGERAISVPRLQRLSAFYGVAVDQLLPPLAIESAESDEFSSERRGQVRGITIDLRKLDELSTAEAALLSRYVGMIKSQRFGFRGSELTMRREDLNALAVLLEADVESVKDRIAYLGFELVN
jgi:transcriptional regulator with XRE-family HTH domain